MGNYDGRALSYIDYAVVTVARRSAMPLVKKVDNWLAVFFLLLHNALVTHLRVATHAHTPPTLSECRTVISA